MLGKSPVLTLGFCAVLAGAALAGWNISPAERQFMTPKSVAVSRIVAMPICGSGKRMNCVVDGDTIWVNREKIRLEGFNTPELNGVCARERRLAVQARDELRQALNGHRFSIERNGQDRYGRTLATVRVDGINVGEDLIRKGLAHEWRGFKESWC